MKEHIKSEIEKYEIISFDIFDTLLFRNVPHPQDIFTVIEQKYNISGFKRKRIKAEIKAREYSPYDEVTLEEIYLYLENFNIQDELSVEKSALYANPDLKDIYDYANQLDKKIICISDMYLDKKFLKDVLHSQGYKNIQEIFVSSELRDTKESGKLYDIVLTKMKKYNAKQLLHIGDNYHSDLKMSNKKGIQAIHYTPFNQKKNISSCKYKEALMKQDMYSLQLAQSIKLGLVNDSEFEESSFNCQIKWLLHIIKVLYFKCEVMGVNMCIKKVTKKILK